MCNANKCNFCHHFCCKRVRVTPNKTVAVAFTTWLMTVIANWCRPYRLRGESSMRHQLWFVNKDCAYNTWDVKLFLAYYGTMEKNVIFDFALDVYFWNTGITIGSCDYWNQVGNDYTWKVLRKIISKRGIFIVISIVTWECPLRRNNGPNLRGTTENWTHK